MVPCVPSGPGEGGALSINPEERQRKTFRSNEAFEARSFTVNEGGAEIARPSTRETAQHGPASLPPGEFSPAPGETRAVDGERSSEGKESLTASRIFPPTRGSAGSGGLHRYAWGEKRWPISVSRRLCARQFRIDRGSAVKMRCSAMFSLSTGRTEAPGFVDAPEKIGIPSP